MSGVLSPRGYHVRVAINDGATQVFDITIPQKREAIRVCRREALAAGLGAKGEVVGGVRMDSAIFQCRVGRDDAGDPKIIVEEL